MTTFLLNPSLRRPLWLVLGFGLALVSRGAEPDPAVQAEARLREALRTTTLQLRTAQNELAALQVAQADKEKELAAAQGRIAALVKQGAADRDAAAKNAASLTAVVTEQESQLASLKDSQEKWKASSTEATELARTTEAARVELTARVAALERKVAERESQNIALAALSTEILNRLKDFGLGDALAAREPFIGRKRTEIQTLVQDYGDKIADQRAVKGSAPAAR